MLDFYFIRDSENSPEYPDEERYLGSISLEQHKALRCVFQKCESYDIHIRFFEDTRLFSDQTKRLLACCKECFDLINEEDSLLEEALINLMDLLEFIVKENYGLMAFCD